MESHSKCVSIEANFEVFVSEPTGRSSLGIYDIVDAAPKLTTDGTPPVIVVEPLWKKPHVLNFKGKDYAYYKVKIEINGALHGTTFKKACSDFELFIAFLLINHVQPSDGKATISDFPLTIDSKTEFQNYNFDGIEVSVEGYRNGKKTENMQNLISLLGSL